MSLITRCPACETMFRVVPDQLRISNGWVRCGQCAEIFDAAHHLIEAAPAPDVATATSQEPLRMPRQAAEAQAASPADVDLAVAVAIEQHTPFAPTEAPPAWSASPTGAAGPSDTPPVPFAAPDSPAAPTPEPQRNHDTLQDVSFLRKGVRSPSVWQRPLVRTALVAIVLLLLAVLAVQVVAHERDRIAASAPATRPVLHALCTAIGCTLAPLRQIESIVIDGSSFGRIRGDTYRLALSLRNNARIEVAMPAIELALTDPQDQAVVRRVILPAEFGAPSATLAAGADWSGSLAMQVRVADNAERIAGYRVLAFYP